MKKLLVSMAMFAGVASAVAWEGPKVTCEPDAAPVRRTWEDLKSSIAASIAKTGEGYFALSHKYNEIGPLDTSGTLTDTELQTQFAMACVLNSPMAVRGKAKPQVAKWLGTFMLMNAYTDFVARQGRVVAEQDGALVVTKYLWGMNNGNQIVAFYNPTDSARRISVTARELCLAGPVKWVDRFDDREGGTAANELAFDVPAHGTKLVWASGREILRREYRAECARVLADGSIDWAQVYVPQDGTYVLMVETPSIEPVTVRVNGLDAGTLRGANRLAVKLYAPENVVNVRGPGASAVQALNLFRVDSMLDTIVSAYLLARCGRDSAVADALGEARVMRPDAEVTSLGPVEERALDWVHDALWEWPFDWVWARGIEAGGDRARAIEKIEKGCFRYRGPNGVEPDDPAFWAHYKQLTGKECQRGDVGGQGKKATSADPFDVGKSQTKKTLNAVEWQNANDKALAAAVTVAELDNVVASGEAADKALADVKGAYDTDPKLATKLAAVTARTMEKGQAAKRRIWADALLKAAVSSADGYRTLFFLEQLRWCGFADQVGKIEELGRTSKQEGVATFVAMLVRELEAKSR